uniref:DNA-directed DNA polymerase n=1 Tax=Romanomermis culicivorax TaxID=13658 RepID=A0A915L1G7_ROMCU
MEMHFWGVVQMQSNGIIKLDEILMVHMHSKLIMWMFAACTHISTNMICKNLGKQAIAKKMLNSFWGKFGQHNNFLKTIILDNREEYSSIIFDHMNLVKSINLINDTSEAITYT